MLDSCALNNIGVGSSFSALYIFIMAGSDEDIDLEESDDDLEAPSFLFSLEEAR